MKDKTIIEERIEKAKHRLVTVLTNIENSLERLLAENKRAEAEQEAMRSCYAQAQSKIDILEDKNRALMQELCELNMTSVKSAASAASVQSAAPAIQLTPEEPLIDKKASEYIDVSINQFKHLLKQKNK